MDSGEIGCLIWIDYLPPYLREAFKVLMIQELFSATGQSYMLNKITLVP